MKNYFEIKNRFKALNLADGTYVLDSIGTGVILHGGYQASFETPSDDYTQEKFDLICDAFEQMGYKAFVGVWQGVVEISFHTPSKGSAKAMATLWNQEGIWDWANNKFIPTKEL